MNMEMVRTENLVKYFPVGKKLFFFGEIRYIRAVDGVSISIRRGETLGLVGESGCGKTTLGFCILGIEKPTSGKIYFKGVDVTDHRSREIKKHMQIVFQDPKASFDPRIKIIESVGVPLEVHKIARGREKDERVLETLELVGLSEEHAYKYPHELSGGQLQRAAVARAIITNPEFIVLDEPTSALDVSVRSQILNLLADLQNKFNMTYLLITHDISVVRYLSNRVAVMYLGKIIETSSADDMFKNPRHPYTLSLLSAVPVPNPRLRGRKRIILLGEPPNPINVPSGCRFHPRCPFATDICKKEEPELVTIEGDHQVACHRVDYVEKVSEFEGFAG